jgi:ketosteroid isomerase-like protein
MTATADARSVVKSFYANLAEGKPQAAFALCSDGIEWNEAEGNPLADRNPYRVIVIGRYHGTHRKGGAKLDCQPVHSWWVEGGRIVRFQQYADTAQLARLA